MLLGLQRLRYMGRKRNDRGNRPVLLGLAFCLMIGAKEPAVEAALVL